MTPKPVTRRPGSMPRIRMSEEKNQMQRYYNEWCVAPAALSRAPAARNKKPGGCDAAGFGYRDRAGRVRSVTEVTHARQDHRDAVLVRCRDHFVVAHRAARLDHAGRACRHDDVETVAE